MALWVGTSAPANTNLIWLDTSLATPLHKAYNPTSSSWEPFIYLTLIDNSTIKKDGDGKLYVDVSTIPALQVADGSITLIKLANVASGSVFYRKSLGTGVPEVQTLATLKTDLGLIGTNSGDQDLSGLALKATTINSKSLATNIILTPEDIGSPEGSGTSTGENTGDETKVTILQKLEISTLSGENTGDETKDSVLELFTLTDDESDPYTLILTSELERLQSIEAPYLISLPSDTTVEGRITGLIEGTDYPTGWTIAVGSSEFDLLITHNLNKRVANINIYSVSDGQERLLRPFNNAYTGILLPNLNSVLIEALSDIQTEIKISITFN